MQSNQPVNNNPSWGAIIGAGLGGAAAVGGSRFYTNSYLDKANNSVNEHIKNKTLDDDMIKKQLGYLQAKSESENYKSGDKTGLLESKKAKAKAYSNYRNRESDFISNQNESYKKYGSKVLGSGKRRAAGLGASIIAGGLLGNAIDN